ncbi:MAG: AEC family transporter [Epulopiscium sp.]|jgi:predicted permease|nr:AEC family transporter [Candidatus Epulonipiscium sp.]HOQ17713.1 AEC family transporter [Defluviitaleaceae bacterium]HPT75585.1 AEC family transporter [Defluviitaleaceae bacterium]
MNFQSIFNQILILFLLLVIGYGAKKRNVFDDSTIKGISSILVKLTLPALIINSLTQEQATAQSIKESGLILLLSFFIYLLSFIIALLVPKLIASKKEETGIFEFTLLFSNVGFMGYPVVQAVLGDEALFYVSFYNLPFNVFVFTIGLWMLTKGKKHQKKFDWKLFINTGTISVIIGFILFLFSIPIPAPITGCFDILGSMTTPLSMLVIGGLLANTESKYLFSNWRIYVISFTRLIIIPLIIYGMLSPFVYHKYLLGVPVIIGAMPAAANTAILASEYGANSELASRIVFISTLFSVITIPLISLLLI